ncbi:16S rRNA (cytosine(1402)-N(4))-methyltransferase RsmH [Candidatus Peribacteria bacterium]|nr:16S rRNA (cytosine(1402)-N(4))-methyltransferase RsmH [Candidatus Peribacteria bacterium]
MNSEFHHIPVLQDEVINFLSPKPGERLLDCTLGLGGHAKALIDTAGGDLELVGIDADPDNLSVARENLLTVNCQLFHANFRQLADLHLGTFDIILADLGVSSPHFDDPDRGFSLRSDGPLDMRLDRTSGVTAAQLIAESSEASLANILYEYGEIRQSRKLAAAIKVALPTTTKELRTLCETLFGYRAPGILPQVFQALRIAVNDELGALQSLLQCAPNMLKPGGRLGIISFHSLEDRLVKKCFKEYSTPKINETTGAPIAPAPFVLVTKKAIQPTAEEVENNPRSRSAKFRVILFV